MFNFYLGIIIGTLITRILMDIMKMIKDITINLEAIVVNKVEIVLFVIFKNYKE